MTRDYQGQSIPLRIVQYRHNLEERPDDVQECMNTWSRWGSSGFEYRVFDARSASRFIERSLGRGHMSAFMRCYHPAMQADYFRLCYLVANGGMYVDADDVCISNDISELFVGSSLKVQPLCYDIASDSMVESKVFLQAGTNREGLIFYVNNNPLIACKADPIVSRALERATLRLNFAAEKLQGNIGLYYYDQDSRETIDDTLLQDVRGDIFELLPGISPALAPFAPPIAALYDDPFQISRDGVRGSETENWALFGNIEYTVNDFITLFAGLRYDSEEVSNFSNEERQAISALPDPATLTLPLDIAATQINRIIERAINVESLDNNADYDAFLPKAGITLNWTQDLATSFTIQRGYRAGGAGTSGAGNFEFDPEFTTNYDFALRSQWFDQRLTVNANVFYIDWTDQQVQIVEPTVQTDFITINAGESELTGFELEVTAYPSDTFEFYFNLGYVDTEFTDFPVDEGLSNQDLTGNEFPSAPELTSAAGLVYHATNHLKLQLDGNYQRASFDNADNTLKNDSRTVFNAKATYRINDTLELALLARNLFDKDYIILDNISNTQTVKVGQPRTVALQLQGSW